MDFFGSLNSYNFLSDGAMADSVALASDWLAVYGDLNKAYSDTICQIETKKTAV